MRGPFSAGAPTRPGGSARSPVSPPQARDTFDTREMPADRGGGETAAPEPQSRLRNLLGLKDKGTFGTVMMPRGELEKEVLHPGVPGRPLAIVCKSCQKVTRKKTQYCDFCGRPLPNLEGSVILNCRWSGGRTPDGTPAVYLTCTVRPSIRFLSGTPLRNLGFLIDMSSQRRESDAAARIRNVRRILEHVVDELTPSDFLTVAFFGRRPYLLVAGERIDDSKSVRRLLQKKIDSIDLGEGRFLADGIEQVGREVRRNFSQEKINRVIIVTDGPCLDPEKALQACRYETEGGVNFSVITLHEGPWNDFLEDLAHAGNGKAYPGIETRHIPEILSQELMTVRPTYTTQVEIFFHVDPGWSVTRAFKISPLIVDLGARTTDRRVISVKLTDLQIYEDQTLLLELCPVSVDPKRRTLALAELVCDFPKDEVTNMSFTLPMQVQSPQDACQQENEDVLQTVRMIMAVFGRKTTGA